MRVIEDNYTYHTHFYGGYARCTNCLSAFELSEEDMSYKGLTHRSGTDKPIASYWGWVCPLCNEENRYLQGDDRS